MWLYNQAKTLTFSGSLSFARSHAHTYTNTQAHSYTAVHQHTHVNTQVIINKILVWLWRSIKVLFFNAKTNKRKTNKQASIFSTQTPPLKDYGSIADQQLIWFYFKRSTSMLLSGKYNCSRSFTKMIPKWSLSKNMKADTHLDGETTSEASHQAAGRGILSAYWQQWCRNILLLQVQDCSEWNETLRIEMYILAWWNSVLATDLLQTPPLPDPLRYLWKEGKT